MRGGFVPPVIGKITSSEREGKEGCDRQNPPGLQLVVDFGLDLLLKIPDHEVVSGQIAPD